MVGNRVYLTTAVPDETVPGARSGACLDATTGTVVWNQEVFHPDVNGPASMAKNGDPTPLFRDGKIFVHLAIGDGRSGSRWKVLAPDFAFLHSGSREWMLPIWAEGSLVSPVTGQ